jgi:glycerol-3-phosphate dehydrogenase
VNGPGSSRSSPGWRAAALGRLADETFDALIVGGGATGAAIARDAALRGLGVALCEHGDFAGQTSSHSSKLIHGGLRYLQYGDLPLVFEGLRERRRLLDTAPHLCRPVEFLFPAYRAEQPSLGMVSLGVALYDALALWRPPVSSRRASAGEVYHLSPLLRSAGLVGAALYVDCQTDDARLVLENVLDAESAGAVAASYVRVEGGAPDRQPAAHLRTVEVLDRQSGERFPVRARAVVNAAGPFSDAFRGGAPALRPTLGVHIVLDAARLPTGGRVVVIHSPRDGRLIFTLPAGARTIVGTTDTDRAGDRERPPDPDDEIRAHGADVDYLLEAVNDAFPPVAVGRDEVISTFAGLRPLLSGGVGSPSSLSREHDIWIDRRGVLTVAGGKLTTMRRMGEEAVDRLVELLRERGVDRPLAPCSTATRPLPGGARAADLDDHELAADVRARLVTAYGGRAGQVATLAATHEPLAHRLAADLPYLRAEVVFAARHDRTVELEDVLCRRVPLFRDAIDRGLSVVEEVADLIGGELDWTPAQRARSVDRYRSVVATADRWRQE